MRPHRKRRVEVTTKDVDGAEADEIREREETLQRLLSMQHLSPGTLLMLFYLKH